MKKGLSKLLYNGKHFAPLGADLFMHAPQIHALRTQLSQLKKSGSFHKINTMAESLPASTKEFSLIEERVKNGKTQTVALFPSPKIVSTHQTQSGGSLTSTDHGPGYMEALQTGGTSVHHEGVRKPQDLSQMPYFGSAPVTDPNLMKEVAALRAKNGSFSGSE
ncbi:hypothetical protein WKR88_18745 [Trinickia caryophylli]|uniref:Uncharacterized protein n=1 Tax=Trinickia caryophylli TaxID=28094 RepID=A0A1X7DHX4_TRICW|nr:hypothetical protein [Trinickia caryophylli]PMS12339.1 hypothetical protein C0Z17_10275 [Trinickia caryophylli]TRX16987.1 hypothetical protein FNF07_01245 [Trinickia caryophylli]WQE12275.1 hypothetical protein U0034_02305 [Trinickia caryophylli]SMF15517.1 hypothetical protein SAMN06295900_103210 [Trinickia caryophylli]GLU31580.1 hypothetical protein Busp01_14220 [Trinickia caryophylli]